MLAVIISWFYMFILCTFLGIGTLRLLARRDFSLSGYLMAGIIAITVYTEFSSLFIKTGAVSHILLLSAALLSGYYHRNTIRQLFKRYFPILRSWEGFFYGCFIVLAAFFASRGEFHTDTNIYHAAAIRIYEEYGLIRGIGNLQLHYAYNSSYLAFAAQFSLKWLLGFSLHTTTGFLETVLCLYAFRGLAGFGRHKNHITDLLRVGILLYALINITRSMSPATDYAAMYFALYLLTAWCENLLEGDSDMTVYSLLSVAAVFSVTLKFSSCLLVLLAVYPVYHLIRGKKGKEILLYLLCGCVVLCPFLIRNYFISGWLLYPFDRIDLFQTPWKIPREYLLHDAAQIKVWGRCLYDVEKLDLPLPEWLPVWWAHQVGYEKMFLCAVALGLFLELVILAHKLWKKQTLQPPLLILYFTIWANIALWFFTAPFIRYGLAFLIAAIMFPLGEYLSVQKKNFFSIATGSLVFCILVLVSHYGDEYIIDIGVFAKNSLSDPYYIRQKDYDESLMEISEINGNNIYFSSEGAINSYHVFPGTCYKEMLDRTTLLGETIKDGFCAK